MVVREIGVIYRGFNLTQAEYHEIEGRKINKDIRSALLSTIKNFAQVAFSAKALEYFQGNKYVIAFLETKIRDKKEKAEESLIGYAILDRQKKIDRRINKEIMPLLSQALSNFKSIYEGRRLSEVTQFEEFRNNLNELFFKESLTLDQKYDHFLK